MNDYIYHLQKAVKWVPKVVFKIKRVVIKAKDYPDAHTQLKAKFPDWEVSMFWPEWKPKSL